MTESPVPLVGSTLLVGPSGVGKTRATARALDAWIERNGTDGVVVLDFAPEVHADGRLVGGRLDRFRAIPDDVWSGVLDAHAPRTDAESEAGAVELARDNAQRAQDILRNAPNPRAVFVNDATIALQHEASDVGRVTDYFDRADCAVVNAFESDELGTDDPVSRRERTALRRLKTWAERTIPLQR